MGPRKLQLAAAIALVAAAFAGCGDSGEEEPKPVPGKVVSGETETGMKLKVETFFNPGRDPALKRLADWRALNKFPAVDFHRVTADNSTGQTPDAGRTLRFATDASALATGKSIEARFTCDVLEFEWLPIKSDDTPRWQQLLEDVCADGPPKPEGIAPGATKVYYLMTDRGFAERGIRRMRVFGPRDVELTQGR